MLRSILRTLCLYLIVINILILSSACATSVRGTAYDETASGAESSAAAAEEQAPGASIMEEEEIPPPVEEKPVPTRDIAIGELVREARQNVPDQYVFVCDQELTPLAVYHDLDRNGIEDIFFLLVEVPDGEAGTDMLPVQKGRVSSAYLSDMARLFSEKSEPYSFHLALFLRTPDELISMYRIPLGTWYVFDRFDGFTLEEEAAMPFCIRIDFQTHEGQESQWVAFSRYNKFSFFTLKDSISITMETRDIDRNGVLDIIEWRKVFEEGTGYETFLTWYRWDGTQFSQYDSTNIVRNLNRFMQKSGYLLSSGKWDQALRHILPARTNSDPQTAAAVEDLFLELFPPRTVEGQPGEPNRLSGGIDEEELKSLLASDERIFNTVVFPQVLENPFASGDGTCCRGYKTRFSVRFIFRDGRSLVRECQVRMNSNPFASQQFYLETRDAGE